MVVELLDDPVPPWLGRWNEPEIDAVAQAETNKRDGWGSGLAITYLGSDKSEDSHLVK